MDGVDYSRPELEANPMGDRMAEDLCIPMFAEVQCMHSFPVHIHSAHLGRFNISKPLERRDLYLTSSLSNIELDPFARKEAH
jgi:hypothetical protein